MSKLKLIDLIDGYTDEQDATGARFISFDLSGSFAGKKTSRFWHRVSRFAAALKSLISYTSVRCYSLFLLGFGFVSLIIHFMKDYFGVAEQYPLTTVTVGAVTALFGIFTVFSDKPLSIFLQDIPPLDYICFEFFCLKRVQRRIESVGVPSFVGLLVGIGAAAVASLLPFVPTVIVIAWLVYAYISFLSPEFALFSTFIIMPYLSLLPNQAAVLSTFVVIGLVSFAWKVALGKRVYTIDQYDLCIAFFMLFVMISGIFVKGGSSLRDSLVMILLSSGYVLSGCIITNRRLADCLINALIFSSLPVSGLAIYQFIAEMRSTGGEGFSGVAGTFSNPSVLGVFLLVAFIFSTYFISVRRKRGAKLVYLLIALFILSAMIFTARLAMVVVALLSVAVCLFNLAARKSGAVQFFISLLPSVLILLPGSVADYISSLPIAERLDLCDLITRWQYLKQMFVSSPATGIGIGSDSFTEELSKYFEIDNAPFTNGASFLGEIALEVGVFAVFVFVCLLLIRARHLAVYRAYVSGSHLFKFSGFTTAALAALLCTGAFNYLWEDVTMYFLFWCVFGAGSAALRVSKREHDDRVSYYADGRSSEASSIDLYFK